MMRPPMNLYGFIESMNRKEGWSFQPGATDGSLNKMATPPTPTLRKGEVSPPPTPLGSRRGHGADWVSDLPVRLLLRK